MPRTLLLADDSETIRKVVAIVFAHEDFQVTAVANGDDAIARARELKPDIVLADVVMPGKDGYEVCQALKADPATSGIPVVLLAGTFEPFDEARAQAVGADGHLPKPFESARLVETVKGLVGVSAEAPKARASVPEAVAPVAPPQRPSIPMPPGMAPFPQSSPAQAQRPPVAPPFGAQGNPLPPPPGFGARPSAHPGFPAPPAPQAGFPTAPPAPQAGFPAAPPTPQAGFSAAPPTARPGFPGVPPQPPTGFSPPPSQAGAGMPPAVPPGFPAAPPTRAGFPGTPPAAQAGFPVAPPPANQPRVPQVDAPWAPRASAPVAPTFAPPAQPPRPPASVIVPPAAAPSQGTAFSSAPTPPSPWRVPDELQAAPVWEAEPEPIEEEISLDDEFQVDVELDAGAPIMGSPVIDPADGIADVTDFETEVVAPEPTGSWMSEGNRPPTPHGGIQDFDLDPAPGLELTVDPQTGSEIVTLSDMETGFDLAPAHEPALTEVEDLEVEPAEIERTPFLRGPTSAVFEAGPAVEEESLAGSSPFEAETVEVGAIRRDPAPVDPIPAPPTGTQATPAAAVVQAVAAPADGGEAALRAALAAASREVIEKIAWEVVPQLAEVIVREHVERLVKSREQGS